MMEMCLGNDSLMVGFLKGFSTTVCASPQDKTHQKHLKHQLCHAVQCNL